MGLDTGKNILKSLVLQYMDVERKPVWVGIINSVFTYENKTVERNSQEVFGYAN